MIFVRSAFLTVGCLLFCTVTAKAGPCLSSIWYHCEEAVVDNLNAPTIRTVQIGSGSSAFPNRGTGQSFFNTQNGRLSRIRIEMQRLGIPQDNLTLKLYDVDEFGRVGDTSLAEVDLLRWFVSSLPGRTADFDFRNQEIYLEGGKDYFFSVFVDDGDTNDQFQLPYADGTSYAGGTRYSVWRDEPNWEFRASGDLKFQVLAAVPEPNAFACMGLVALVVGGRAWRSRRTQHLRSIERRASAS